MIVEVKSWRDLCRLLLEEFQAVGVGVLLGMAAAWAAAWYFWSLVGPG